MTDPLPLDKQTAAWLVSLLEIYGALDTCPQTLGRIFVSWRNTQRELIEVYDGERLVWSATHQPPSVPGETP